MFITVILILKKFVRIQSLKILTFLKYDQRNQFNNWRLLRQNPLGQVPKYYVFAVRTCKSYLGMNNDSNVRSSNWTSFITSV